MIRKVITYTLTWLMLALPLLAKAQEIPNPPNPPRLVVDYTHSLTKSQVDQLERRLVNFNDTTSTQIAVVIVPSLNGLTKEEFADRLGEKWGVGRKGKDNGVLLLVKPKTPRERGEARISVGYGLEGAIPDAIARRIVEYDMIPNFKNNDYYSGLYQATETIMGLAAGEFTAEEYRTRTGDGGSSLGIFLFIFFLIIFTILGRIGRRSRRFYGTGSRGSSIWTALLLGSMLSNRGSSGSWGNFRSGSGGFGGGGGGFGGFGGGGFGGGGAGGSW